MSEGGGSNDYHGAAPLSPAPRIIEITFELNKITQQKSYIECILLSASDSFRAPLSADTSQPACRGSAPSSSSRFCFYLSRRSCRCAGCGTASHLAAQSHDTPRARLLQSPMHDYGNGSMVEEGWQICRRP